MERWQQMRRRNCIMVLVCSRRDTKPWPGFYLRTFTPHHRLFPLCLCLHVRLYSSSSPLLFLVFLFLSSLFYSTLPLLFPRHFYFLPFFFFLSLHTPLPFPLPFPALVSLSFLGRLTVTWHYFSLFLIARKLLGFE